MGDNNNTPTSSPTQQDAASRRQYPYRRSLPAEFLASEKVKRFRALHQYGNCTQDRLDLLFSTRLGITVPDAPEEVTSQLRRPRPSSTSPPIEPQSTLLPPAQPLKSASATGRIVLKSDGLDMLSLNKILEDCGKYIEYDAFLISTDQLNKVALLYLQNGAAKYIAICPVELLPTQSVEYFQNGISKAKNRGEKVVAPTNILRNPKPCKQDGAHAYIETDTNSPIAGCAFDTDMFSSLQGERVTYGEDSYGQDGKKKKTFTFFVNSLAIGRPLHPSRYKSISMQYKLTRGGTNPDTYLQLVKRGKLFFVQEMNSLTKTIKELEKIGIPGPTKHERLLQYALGGDEQSLCRPGSFLPCPNGILACCCSVEAVDAKDAVSEDKDTVKGICTKARRHKCSKKRSSSTDSKKSTAKKQK